MRHPHVLQLIMDSLRYWVLDMHVDGFRFDLASSLARQFHEVDRLSAFFDLVQQDPVVSQVKLIAEPWDVGDGGYQVGNFPPLWTEWNGKYRDTVRDYWRGEPGTVGDFASRLSGSSDLYEHSGRKPIASVNFVTAHDGFTIRDLVSYNEKHNEANGEGNNDGESHNRSWNSGVEGDTDDPQVLAIRARQQRNFLVTLMLSQGVPMMLHGDELGRSQRGNNNVYAQDNELSWMPWDLADWQQELLAFTKRVVALRNEHPVFRRRRFFAGEVTRAGGDAADIAWFTPDGKAKEDWGNAEDRALMVFLNGDGIPEPGRRGEPVVDDSFVLAFNPSDETMPFTIPDEVYGEGWVVALDTHDDAAGSVSFFDDAPPLLPGLEFQVADRSVIVLRRPRRPVQRPGTRAPARRLEACLDTTGALPTCPRSTGTTAVVTGANSGIGWYTALELARHGAAVTLAVRTPQKGEDAAARIREAVPGSDVQVGRLDLGSLDSVREFAASWQGPLGLLVNNAGLMAPPRYQQTADGFELQFGTNHLGHFALTGLLLPALQAAPAGRVVAVSSVAHHQGRANVVDGQPGAGLQPVADLRQLQAGQPAVRLRAAAPGLVRGQLGDRDRRAPGRLRDQPGHQRAGPRVDPGGQAGGAAVPAGCCSSPPKAGAEPTLYAATEATPGSYTGPQSLRESRGHVGPAKVGRLARDETLAGKLWQVSEDLTGVALRLGRPGRAADPPRQGVTFSQPSGSLHRHAGVDALRPCRASCRCRRRPGTRRRTASPGRCRRRRARRSACRG